jgi:hypothetical protein
VLLLAQHLTAGDLQQQTSLASPPHRPSSSFSFAPIRSSRSLNHLLEHFFLFSLFLLGAFSLFLFRIIFCNIPALVQDIDYSHV